MNVNDLRLFIGVSGALLMAMGTPIKAATAFSGAMDLSEDTTGELSDPMWRIVGKLEFGVGQRANMLVMAKPANVVSGEMTVQYLVHPKGNFKFSVDVLTATLASDQTLSAGVRVGAENQLLSVGFRAKNRLFSQECGPDQFCERKSGCSCPVETETMDDRLVVERVGDEISIFANTAEGLTSIATARISGTVQITLFLETLPLASPDIAGCGFTNVSLLADEVEHESDKSIKISVKGETVDLVLRPRFRKKFSYFIAASLGIPGGCPATPGGFSQPVHDLAADICESPVWVEEPIWVELGSNFIGEGYELPLMFDFRPSANRFFKLVEMP